MNIQQKFLSTLLLAGLAAAVSGPAWSAQEVVEHRVVRFGDLNLDHPAGIENLYGRLRRAARAVCGKPSTIAPTLKARHRECVRSALGNAVAEVNNRQLTAYYLQKTGADGAQKVVARR